MKKLCCILLTAALVLSVAACSSQSANGSGEGGSIFTDGTSSADSFSTGNDVSSFEQDESYDEEANIQATSTPEPTEEPTPEPTEEPTPEPTPIQVTGGSDFSNGKALVTYHNLISDEWKKGIMTTDGKITPVKTEITNTNGNQCGFSEDSGYVDYIIKDNNGFNRDQFILFDSEGNVTYQTPEDSSYEVLVGGDGVYLVRQTVKSMTENEIRLGIIDKNGSWICEPAVENMLTLPSDAQEKYMDGEVFYSYHGEHVFSAYYRTYYNEGFNPADSYTMLYDADSGQHSLFGNINFVDEYNDDDDTYTSYQFSNGETIAKSEGEIYHVQHVESRFSTTMIMTDRPDGDVFYQDGVFFTGKTYGSGRNPLSSTPEGKFYNIDGSVMLDLSQYNLILAYGADNLYRYENGYAAILIFGEDSIHYLGIIDKDGQLVFDPVAVTYTMGTEVGTLSEGMVTFDPKDDGGNLLSVSGDRVKMDSDAVLIFHDGYAWDDQNSCYINTKGEVLEATLAE